MGRNQTRNTTLSLDTVSIINRLYPNNRVFWEKHLKDTATTIHYFYLAMRLELISEELEQLIESNVDYDLRHLGIDREELALMPRLTVQEIMEMVHKYLQNSPDALIGADLTKLVFLHRFITLNELQGRIASK